MGIAPRPAPPGKATVFPSQENNLARVARAWEASVFRMPEEALLFLDRVKREKGVWWMPWQQEAMKDVIPCDKPRGAGNRLRSVDLRMGEPT